MNDVYLLLGSNEGNRLERLLNAVRSIERQCGPVRKTSSIYETAAWGIEDQPSFLNQAVYLQSVLSPLELLSQTQSIEAEQGRQREVKWGQRTLDIDILFYNDQVLVSQPLTLPHPHLHERRFTLVPLAEIAADLIHPVSGKTISTLLSECSDRLEAVVLR